MKTSITSNQTFTLGRFSTILPTMGYVLTIVLSISTFIISSLPLFKFKTAGIFYALDPDVTYLGNILSYIVHGQIHFFGHPGTPTIRILSLILLPLRFFTEFNVGTPFISWSWSHLDLVYLYVRFGQAALLGLATALFLLAVYRTTRNRLMIIFAWASMFSFSFLPYLGSSIIPETTSFLLVSLWLLIFSYFIKSRNSLILMLLAFIAGVAAGNKLINAFIIIASLVLTFSLKTVNAKQKTKNFLLNLTAVFIGFVWSTWPVRSSYFSLYAWALKLFISSDVHAQGSATVINPSLYLQSIRSFASTNPFPLILIIGLAIFTSFTLFAKKESISSPFNLVALVTLGCIFVFFKYTLSYYQIMPFVVVIYILSRRLVTYSKPIIPVFLIILILRGTIPSIKNYLRITTRAMQEAVNLTDFATKHSSSSTTVWEWGPFPQFALLWGQSYGQAFPSRKMANRFPQIYQITDNLNKLTQGGTSTYEVFDTCWQHLYIQQTSLSTFMNRFPNRRFTIFPIPDTNPAMTLVVSDHCQSVSSPQLSP